MFNKVPRYCILLLCLMLWLQGITIDPKDTSWKHCEFLPTQICVIIAMASWISNRILPRENITYTSICQITLDIGIHQHVLVNFHPSLGMLSCFHILHGRTCYFCNFASSENLCTMHTLKWRSESEKESGIRFFIGRSKNTLWDSEEQFHVIK